MKHIKIPHLGNQFKAILLLIAFVVTTIFTTLILYTKVQELFRWSLDERIIAIVTSGSTQFSAEELDKIGGEESVGTSEYSTAVLKLKALKDTASKIKWAYIFRKTEDPNILEFVAEADSLDPSQQIDLNGDGIIGEEDQLVWPGEEYDISETPAYGQIPFNEPYVEPELDEDQWGTILAGAAPIRYSDGRLSNYIFGVDVDVSEYTDLVNAALLPFILFIVFLFLILSALTAILLRMWKAQVTLLVELDRQKDELLSLVSHQLATPVSSMKWYLEMLLDGDFGKLTTKQEKQLQELKSVASNMNDLVGMILDVSRIQLDRMRLEKQKLELEELFNEVFTEVQPKIAERKIKFNKHIPKNLPVAYLDRRYTKMVIENLLTNAIKYTPEKGQVDVSVEIVNNTFKYIVKDTGCGIPLKDQKKIFGRMYRASNVRNSIDGNGFGLYVVKGAVVAQGGNIGFESKEGKGTTFFVELPLGKEPKKKLKD